MLDGLQEIWFTLRQNKLRTLLTAFGVFWGIFMLILLLGAGRGMQNGIWQDFGSQVLDFTIVWSAETSIPFKGMGVGRKIHFDDADLAAVKQQVPGIRVISPETHIGNGNITYQGKVADAPIVGVPDDYFRIKDDVPFNFGRKPNVLDTDETRKVVALGSKVAERLFAAGEDPVGKYIKVKDVAMRVTGVFDDKSNRGQNSNRVSLPQTTVRQVFGGGERNDTIWIRPQQGVDPFELEKQVLEVLKRRHEVAPEDRRGINSFNMAMPAQSVNALFTGINIFIWFVGLGTLMAGIVGISNIMIITVKERTKEIGVRKALGATPFSIVSTLLLESTLVTGVAGYIGLVFGVGLLELVSFTLRKAGVTLPYFLNPEVDFQVAITAILLLVGVGVLAGLAPAVRAARITPIEAMRAE
jgi:putative ABC transport system permease protein